MGLTLLTIPLSLNLALRLFFVSLFWRPLVCCLALRNSPKLCPSFCSHLFHTVPLRGLSRSLLLQLFPIHSRLSGLFFFFYPLSPLHSLWILAASEHFHLYGIRLWKFIMSKMNITSFPLNLFYSHMSVKFIHNYVPAVCLGFWYHPVVWLVRFSCHLHLPYLSHHSAARFYWLGYFEIVFTFNITEL